METYHQYNSVEKWSFQTVIGCECVNALYGGRLMISGVSLIKDQSLPESCACFFILFFMMMLQNCCQMLTLLQHFTSSSRAMKIKNIFSF